MVTKNFKLKKLGAKLANRPMREVKLDNKHTEKNAAEYEHMVEISSGDPIKEYHL